MKKLVISNYKVKARNEKDEIVDVPYNVKESVVSILFHPSLQLEAMDLLEQNKLANKINDAKDGFVLLEDAEYEKVLKAANTFKGFSKNDVELVRRILEAEQVNVKEK